MFKRVEKRIKKREEDRALNIDDETREALGLNETDSDDSEESDVFDQQDEDESEEWGGLGYEESDVGESSDHMKDDSVDEDDMSEEDLEDVGEKQVSFQVFTVDQTLKEPIYAHPSQSNASLCALCPGKLLIGPVTISQHQASKAHARRSKRISELAALPGNKDRDFSDLLREMDDGKSRVETQGESKRAEKKRKASEIWKVKRKEWKEQEKAKKEKQKQDSEGKEANGKGPARQEHAALSDTKKQPDGKHKAKSAESTSTTKGRDKQTKKSGGEITQPSASNFHNQANKKKRKPEAEKEQEQRPGEKTQPPPSKKRKTRADNAAEKTDITRQIKDIARSAAKRAHQALDKANKGSGGGPIKSKGRKKKSRVK